MGKEQVDEKHEIKFFEIIYKLIEFVSALCLCGQVIIISIAVIGSSDQRRQESDR